ncbi:MAG TPA: tetratricopeptide repeat protein [Phycisphaerae bacterium]|nr:tetratricopeptide repeat protein [Phycisphaerae bacterium]
MKRWILAAIVLGAASGCQQQKGFPDQKVEAQKRWFGTRARVLYQIAENRFSNGQVDGAAESVRQALLLKPDYRDAQFLLARVDIERGRYASAVRRLKDIEKDDPNSSKVAYLLGVAQEKGREFPEALANYRRAYALDESNMSAVKAAAEVLVSMGETRRAQLHVDSYLPKAGEDPGLYELAGRLAMISKEYDRAVAHYLRARDLDPKNLRYLEALAGAEYAAGKYSHVLDTLTELLDRPGYRGGSWVYTMLGDAYLAQGEPHRAFDAYFTASERTPKEPAAWTALARSALAMNDPSRAILAARRALRLAAGQLDATLILGYALLRGGQVDEAMGTLADAARKHPRSPMVHCLLGRAHAAKGNHAEAIRRYTLALKLDPKNAVARELLIASDTKQISKTD